jgi:hypothetical protein
MSEQVIVEDEIVTVVSMGTQGPPGPGLASTDDLGWTMVKKTGRSAYGGSRAKNG